MRFEDIDHADFPVWQAKIGTAPPLDMERLREMFKPEPEVDYPIWTTVPGKKDEELLRKRISQLINKLFYREEIVWLLKSSLSHEAIAKKFDVSIETVQEIFNDVNIT